MSGFADTLFGLGGFLRGTLLVVALLAFAAFAQGPYDGRPGTIAVVVALEMALVLLALAMLAPRRFHWARHALCVLVFVGYAAYVVAEWVEPSGPALAGRRSQSSLGNALHGLAAIGLPALYYATRIWRRRAPLELRFPGPAGAPDGQAQLEWAHRLRHKLEQAGWSVLGPHPGPSGCLLAVERAGRGGRSIVSVSSAPEEQGRAVWCVALHLPRGSHAREDALVALVEQVCGETLPERLEAA